MQAAFASLHVGASDIKMKCTKGISRLTIRSNPESVSELCLGVKVWCILTGRFPRQDRKWAGKLCHPSFNWERLQLCPERGRPGLLRSRPDAETFWGGLVQAQNRGTQRYCGHRLGSPHHHKDWMRILRCWRSGALEDVLIEGPSGRFTCHLRSLSKHCLHSYGEPPQHLIVLCNDGFNFLNDISRNNAFFLKQLTDQARMSIFSRQLTHAMHRLDTYPSERIAH